MVEAWGWHWLNRQLSTEVRTSLSLSSEGVVDDAMHFIFECTATSSIREQPEFAMTLQNNNENLHDFILSPCAPLFVHLALTADGLSGASHHPLEKAAGLMQERSDLTGW
ncbi:hypothetical protein HaLaN_23880 [Haematococcus lacustris]|uniref:Uncharacterized protein n=1 Tax=Haematococcus lacustris TaxID=44745 RepID=A0A6A0A2P9_HAELA|nr:hypothetical protein HaLaN_23880 [Haematococcus lacustris]